MRKQANITRLGRRTKISLQEFSFNINTRWVIDTDTTHPFYSFVSMTTDNFSKATIHKKSYLNYVLIQIKTQGNATMISVTQSIKKIE